RQGTACETGAASSQATTTLCWLLFWFFQSMWWPFTVTHSSPVPHVTSSTLNPTFSLSTGSVMRRSALVRTFPTHTSSGLPVAICARATAKRSLLPEKLALENVSCRVSNSPYAATNGARGISAAGGRVLAACCAEVVVTNAAPASVAAKRHLIAEVYDRSVPG